MNEANKIIGRVETLPIRKIFAKEAQNFTTWLESHIDALAERIGVELTVVQREKDVGEFNVDLLCEDSDQRPVVIENQLEKTDHDHLGKLLTYLVNLGASAAIWVTTHPRPEHEKVIDWLNESTPLDISFYLVKVEAIRIGTSAVAPLFNILVAPDRQAKEIGKKKKEWAERHHQRFEFWKSLLEKSKDKTKLFSNVRPGRENWISTGAGKAGVSLSYVVLMDGASVILYIDHDKDTGKKNKEIFDALHAQKVSIEQDVGRSLEWDRLDEKRASRIRMHFKAGGLSDPESWPSLQEAMIDGMVKFQKAIRPRLAKL